MKGIPLYVINRFIIYQKKEMTEMKSRLNKFVLVLATILSLVFASVVAAQGETTVYVEPADQTIPKNAETTVEVWISDVVDFYGAQFELAFDDTVVEGLSVVEGAAFTAYPDEYEVVQSEIVSATVKFAATLLRVPKAGPLSGDVHLATITFQGVEAGTSELILGNVQVADSEGRPVAFVTQDGSITVECVTALEGNAYLEGREDHSGITVTLEGNTVLTATTDISGTYAFVGLPAGTYTMTLSHDNFLAIEVADVTVTECETTALCSYMLLAGDLNNDGVIDISDLALCAANFGSAGPDGDVNADGVVDIYDLVLIGKNFKLASPQVGVCLS